MKSKKLITPQYQIQIGQYTVTQGAAWECISSKDPKADWCKIELHEQLKNVISFEATDYAEVRMGYDGDYSTLISGYVKQLNSGYWKELLIKNDMILLETIEIKASFIDCRPQDIVKYILTAAGIEETYHLNDTEHEPKKVVSIDRKNGIQALQEVNYAWGMQHSFFFQDREFYWGCKKQQDIIYVLEEGNNILSLNRYSELWEIETLGIPWIHHSELIEVQHSKFTGVTEVHKTIIKTDENGFVRMNLYFKGE